MTASGAVPHFHFHDDVAMARLMQLRADLLGVAQAQGTRLTMLAFVIKVTASLSLLGRQGLRQKGV